MTYATPAAFRTALEARLNAAAEVRLDTDPKQGRADAEAFLAPVLGAGDEPGRWDPQLRRWDL